MRLSLAQKIASIVVMLSLPALGLFLAGLDRAKTDINQLSQAMQGYEDIRALWNAAEIAADSGTIDLQILTAIAQRVDLAENVRETAVKLAESQQAKPSVPRYISGVASIIHEIKITAGLLAAVDSKHAALPGVIADQLPVLLVRKGNIVRIIDRVSNKDDPGTADRMAVMVNAGQYKSIADGLSRSTRGELTALPEVTSGKVQEAAAAYRKANSGLQKAMAKIAHALDSGKPDPGHMQDFIASSTAFDTAVSMLSSEAGMILEHFRINLAHIRSW